jgi:hypothetical protein
MAVAFMGGVMLAELQVFKMAMGAAARNSRIDGGVARAGEL